MSSFHGPFSSLFFNMLNQSCWHRRLFPHRSWGRHTQCSLCTCSSTGGTQKEHGWSGRPTSSAVTWKKPVSLKGERTLTKTKKASSAGPCYPKTRGKNSQHLNLPSGQDCSLQGTSSILLGVNLKTYSIVQSSSCCRLSEQLEPPGF